MRNIRHAKKLINLSFIFVVLYSCGTKEVYTEKSSNKVPLIMSYKVPHDLPINASQEDIANFAWNQFFALNWKAEWTSENQTRFKPDTPWFASQQTPELAVSS